MNRLATLFLPLSLLACGTPEPVDGLYRLVELETDCERGPEQTMDLGVSLGCQDGEGDCDRRRLWMDQSGLERRSAPIECEEVPEDGLFSCIPNQSNSYHLTVTPSGEALDVVFEQYLEEGDPLFGFTETPYCSATYVLRFESRHPEPYDFSLGDRLMVLAVAPILPLFW
jgi:hypothetical protein